MAKINTHIIFISILFALALVYLNSLLHGGVILNNIHYINDLTFLSYNYRESLRNNELPLWTPYFYSGHPLLAIPENYMFDLNFILIYLFGNIYLAMNLSLLLYLFIAGAGMYLLSYNLSKSKNAAFISAILYMLNGFVHSFLIVGHINLFEGYALIPFIFLFTYRALKERNWILYSILSGIFFALQILSGSFILFFYTALIVAFFILFNLIGGRLGNSLTKSFLVGVIILLVSLGLASIKFLPTMEFTDMSSRGAKVSFNEFLGHPLDFKNILRIAVSNFKYDDISAAVGLIGFAFVAFGLLDYKRKLVLFFLLLMMFSIMLASNLYLGGIIYKIPGFDRLRHVERALVLFSFSASLLAAYGFVSVSEIMRRRSFFLKFENIIFAFVVVLILAELLFFQPFPSSAGITPLKDIGVLQYMGNDKSDFRTINLAQKEVVGAAGYNYYAQKGISEVKGGGGIWIPDYTYFVAVSQQTLNQKLLGILNVKYLISDTELKSDNISFIGKFNECKGECPGHDVWNSYGPYLYKNDLFMPRYYVVPNSVLLAGEVPNQVGYKLIMENLNPMNTVIVQEPEVGYSGQEIPEKFGIIISSKNSKDFEIKLNPKISGAVNGSSGRDLSYIMGNLEGRYKEVKAIEKSFNMITIGLNGEKGWLVLSERFAYFPGWKATINGKSIPILKANNAISAMYVDGERGKLVFEYSPNSYRKGRLISAISLIAVLGCLCFGAYKNYRRRR